MKQLSLLLGKSFCRSSSNNESYSWSPSLRRSLVLWNSSSAIFSISPKVRKLLWTSLHSEVCWNDMTGSYCIYWDLLSHLISFGAYQGQRRSQLTDLFWVQILESLIWVKLVGILSKIRSHPVKTKTYADVMREERRTVMGTSDANIKIKLLQVEV